ncbi:hypothetical protein EG68_03025 [Paragonimus skrjabini miyazakii]|uniref:Uncharacterized protein n=1 Tax=Paragonimus skrjabini miyazakii TaxID=59628 RepID=A0A8S9YYY8_9TREM|nr:hypothetical protein EG68_03025 [Paragonimus skrjabini miyazakii]
MQSTEKSIQPNSSVTYNGWLRKLGGKFKTWKKRYFVLEGTQLSYYTSPDDQRALGKFSLESTQIEIPNVTDAEFGGDNKGFVFIVKPESSNDNLSANHTQFVLSAQTAEERKCWIRAFRKALYLKNGGALFGTPLNEVFPYTKPEHSYLPRVVYETVEFIRINGIDCEGVFRKCGAQNVIQELADAYDVAATGPILQPDQHNVHVAAGLLKLYLRELPEPIIPFDFYERLKATGFHIADGQDLTVLIRTLEMLPAPNYHLLQFLCQFLFEVSKYAQSNLMTIENLASVFAPNVLRLADGDLDVEMAASPIINLTMAEFIRCHSRLFRLEMVPLNSMDNSVFGSVSKRNPASSRRRRFHTTTNVLSSPPPSYEASNQMWIEPTIAPSKSFYQPPNESVPINKPVRANMTVSHFRSPFYEARLSPTLSPPTWCDRNGVEKLPPKSPTGYDNASAKKCSDLPSTCVGNFGRTENDSICTMTRLSNQNSPSLFQPPKIQRSNKTVESNRVVLNVSEMTDSVQSSNTEQSLFQNDRIKSESHRSTMPSKEWQGNLFSPNDVSCHSQGFSIDLSKPPRITEKYSNTLPRPPPFHFPNNVNQTFPHSGKSVIEKREAYRNKPKNNLALCMEPPNQTNSDAYLLANVSAILDPDDEARYWHAVAVSARAEAAGHRAHVATLNEELNRTKCDLDMAELEIGLLRQQLAHVQSSLKGLGYRAQPPTISTRHKMRGHPFASDFHHDPFDVLWNWSR